MKPEVLVATEAYKQQEAPVVFARTLDEAREAFLHGSPGSPVICVDLPYSRMCASFDQAKAFFTSRETPDIVQRLHILAGSPHLTAGEIETVFDAAAEIARLRARIAELEAPHVARIGKIEERLDELEEWRWRTEEA